MSSPSPGLKIASLRGVPVYIGRSWPLIAIVIVALFGPQVARLHPEWGLGAYAFAVAYALLLLVSVLVHEAAHALTGLACGYRVNRIVADLWGGHTAYDSPDSTPGRSALVAAVGPLSNAVMAFGGYLALQQVSGDGAAPLLLMAFTWSNAFVALFNALPGLPLDGGFVVDALVWKITGSRAKGMKAAGWCGRAVAVGVVLWALLPVLTGSGFASMWTLVWSLLIASFLWRGATAAVNVGSNREFLGGIRVADVMRPALAVPATTPIAELPETGSPLVLLDGEARPVAVVPPGAHVRVPFEQRASVPASALGEALLPDAVALVADAHADVTAVLPAFEGEPTPGMVVVLEPGAAVPGAAVPGASGPQPVRVRGLVLLADLERAMVAHAGANQR